MISASIVIYNTDVQLLEKAMLSYLHSAPNSKLFIVDNSENKLKSKLLNLPQVTYIFNNSNLGYGAAHNVAINNVINESKYHIVINPDIVVGRDTIKKLYDFMEENPDVGSVMPKVLYPDGSLQYLCKLLPTPIDLFFRRFIPFKTYLDKRDYIYELRFTGYTKIMEVPYLSGCFMFLRISALQKVGLFDERFFMYPEDIDLTRRIHKKYRTIFFPEASIVHDHAKESFRSFKMLRIHIWNILKYFNKWGWFFDQERSKINKKILCKLKGEKDDNCN